MKRRAFLWFLAGRRAEHLVFVVLWLLECAAAVRAIQFYRHAR